MPSKLLLSALLCQAMSAQAAWVEQPAQSRPGVIGLLLLARPGSWQWEGACRSAADRLEAEGPVQLVFGPDDFRAVQNAVDELQDGSKKILAVPLGVAANSDDFEQFRYAAGISSRPYASAVSANGYYPSGVVPRLRIRVPMVMSPGFEESLLPEERLAAVLKPHLRSPETVSLVVLGQTRPGLRDFEILPFLEKLAASLKRRNKLYSAQAFLLHEEGPARMDKSVSGDTAGPATKPADYRPLRGRIRSLAPRSRVLVAAYSPEDDDLDRFVGRELDGSFYTWAGAVSFSSADIVRHAREAKRTWEFYPSMKRYSEDSPAAAK